MSSFVSHCIPKRLAPEIGRSRVECWHKIFVMMTSDEYTFFESLIAEFEACIYRDNDEGT